MQAKEHIITGIVAALIATIFNNLLGGSLINFSFSTIYVLVTTVVIGVGVGFAVLYFVNLRNEEKNQKSSAKPSKR